MFSYNNEADIRPALQGLLYISAEHKVPMLFVAHWRKGEGESQDMTSGSAAWRQVVRHGLDFAAVGAGMSEAHALWVGKSNHYRRGFVRAYSLEEVEEWDTARFTLGDAEPFDTIDDWLKHQRAATRGEKVTIDPAEIMHDYLRGNLVAGQDLPPRDTLRRQLTLTHRETKEALATLQHDGHIELLAGNTYRWRGNRAGQ
jgi:hypothetical protein